MLELLYYPDRAYRTTFGLTPPTTASRLDLVKRITATYRRERFSMPSYGDSIWADIDRRRRRIDDVLVNGSYDEIDMMLQTPACGDILFGFENTFSEYVQTLKGDVARQQLEARWIHDAATRLAEALGAIRTAGPEAPHLDQAIDVPDLVRAIEQHQGAHIDFPNPFPDEFGIDTGRGKASLRAIHAIYQAFRVNALQALTGGSTVMEIGAGLGRTAYYCTKLFGMPYTIYDLPLTNVAQAYFLGALLGEDQIALGDEFYDPTVHAVRILSVNNPLEPQHRTDLVLNVDSLTELDRLVAATYLDFAARYASAFVSINHEAQAFSVNELFAQAGLRAQRFPYWMRKGYVEEIWLRTPEPLRSAKPRLSFV